MSQPSQLRETEVHRDPIAQFRRWFDEAVAAGEPQPEAVCLATADERGRPCARMVLLRGYSDAGLVFFTNCNSRKAAELAANPTAALVFYWFLLQRQVRIEGQVMPVDADEADAYFRTRPRGHQLNAWASPQSEVIPDRAFLEARMREFEERFPDEVPRPPFWSGYRVVPESIEFWQGGENRLHDRLVYRKTADGWRIQRLAP
ncbi:MAG: pyridoxamine 5'-phosphate oxidase [Planctomycetes bacterium]|nr:pyridoxamine 5'-phosphate oxidase [Planctomycetota bacterium]